MPIIKRAIKKLAHDRKRSKQNETVERALSIVVKKARKSPTAKTVSSAFASLDKAAKHHIIHKNKASRLKARLAKLLGKK